MTNEQNPIFGKRGGQKKKCGNFKSCSEDAKNNGILFWHCEKCFFNDTVDYGPPTNIGYDTFSTKLSVIR